MPLPDDVQLESLGFWRTMREHRGLYVARQRVDISFYVPNEDEVTRTGVADVGVDGDRTPRVSLHKVGELLGGEGGVTRDGAVCKTPDPLDETNSGGG